MMSPSFPRKGSMARVPSEALISSDKKLVRPPSSSKNILANKHQNYSKMLEDIQAQVHPPLTQKNALLKIESTKNLNNVERLPRSYKYIK